MSLCRSLFMVFVIGLSVGYKHDYVFLWLRKTNCNQTYELAPNTDVAVTLQNYQRGCPDYLESGKRECSAIIKIRDEMDRYFYRIKYRTLTLKVKSCEMWVRMKQLPESKLIETKRCNQKKGTSAYTWLDYGKDLIVKFSGKASDLCMAEGTVSASLYKDRKAHNIGDNWCDRSIKIIDYDPVGKLFSSFGKLTEYMVKPTFCKTKLSVKYEKEGTVRFCFKLLYWNVTKTDSARLAVHKDRSGKCSLTGTCETGFHDDEGQPLSHVLDHRSLNKRYCAQLSKPYTVDVYLIQGCVYRNHHASDYCKERYKYEHSFVLTYEFDNFVPFEVEDEYKEDDEEDEGLTGWEIFGIVVGCIIGFPVCIACCYGCCTGCFCDDDDKKSTQGDTNPASEPLHTELNQNSRNEPPVFVHQTQIITDTTQGGVQYQTSNISSPQVTESDDTPRSANGSGAYHVPPDTVYPSAPPLYIDDSEKRQAPPPEYEALFPEKV